MNRPLHIIVVEDSPDDAELLDLQLRHQGYAPESVVLQSLDLLAKELDRGVGQLVLADYSLQDFTAKEALEVLKRSGKDVPFIVVSGSVGEETAVELMKAGASDFFLKDRLARLGAAIERELREAEIRRERREAMARLEESERRLRQAVQARDEFLSIASHELKTPLTPLELQLATAIDLLRHARASKAALSPHELEKLEAKLGKVARHVDRLTALVNNLLDVTRIASGRLSIDRQRVDLVEVVKSLLSRWDEAIKRSGSSIRLDAQAPVVGSWDPIGAEAMANNLLSNAIKFGAGKAIEVSIEQKGHLAIFSIHDHGIGIPPEEQERIFQRFERAVPSKHYGGFGIGLWATRQIARAHGGDIQVVSHPGDGSTFTIELPVSTETENT